MKKQLFFTAGLAVCLFLISAWNVSAQQPPRPAAPTAQATAQPTTRQSEPVYKDFRTELVLEAKVHIGSMVNVGESKRGSRRIIPITGGTFEGPKMKGTVLPMGEDWQLTRPDGSTELSAIYLLKTDDGVVIRIHNQVLMGQGGAARSVIDFEAPLNSPYAWMNNSIFLGTLGFGQGQPSHVVITVYKVL